MPHNQSHFLVIKRVTKLIFRFKSSFLNASVLHASSIKPFLLTQPSFKVPTQAMPVGLLTCLAITISACQSIPVSKESVQKTSAQKTDMGQLTHTVPVTDMDALVVIESPLLTPEQLARYDWTLISAIDNHNQPVIELMALKQQITLSFLTHKLPVKSDAIEPTGNTLTGNELAVAKFGVGCNSMVGAYELLDNVINFGTVVQTQKSCAVPLKAAEKQLLRLMGGDSQLSIKGERRVVLTQINPVATLIWQGTLTAESRYDVPAQTVYWKVGHKTEPCPDGSTRVCLRIKPLSYSPQGVKLSEGKWRIFTGEIEGYNHDEEHDSVLRLSRYALDTESNQPAKYAYVLEDMVETHLAMSYKLRKKSKLLNKLFLSLE